MLNVVLTTDTQNTFNAIFVFPCFVR